MTHCLCENVKNVTVATCDMSVLIGNVECRPFPDKKSFFLLETGIPYDGE